MQCLPAVTDSSVADSASARNESGTECDGLPAVVSRIEREGPPTRRFATTPADSLREKRERRRVRWLASRSLSNRAGRSAYASLRDDSGGQPPRETRAEASAMACQP